MQCRQQETNAKEKATRSECMPGESEKVRVAVCGGDGGRRRKGRVSSAGLLRHPGRNPDLLVISPASRS